MWIMLNDCFLSIVAKDCARDELLVRGRRKGDIEKIFPEAVVRRDTTTDYLFRAAVKKEAVERAMVEEIRRIVYSNFKDSVPKEEKDLHDAYHRVWSIMASLQPTRPYSGQPQFNFGTAPKRRRPQSAGGRARAEAMTPEERSEAARHAANVRWRKL